MRKGKDRMGVSDMVCFFFSRRRPDKESSLGVWGRRLLIKTVTAPGLMRAFLNDPSPPPNYFPLRMIIKTKPTSYIE